MKVKKLVSLSPDKFKLMPMDKMIADFGAYCYRCGLRNMTHSVKTFIQWLETEI